VDEEKEWLRIANAMIRYYFHLDPDILSDEEWAMRYNELIWVRKKEAGPHSYESPHSPASAAHNPQSLSSSLCCSTLFDV